MTAKRWVQNGMSPQREIYFHSWFMVRSKRLGKSILFWRIRASLELFSAIYTTQIGLGNQKLWLCVTYKMPALPPVSPARACGNITLESPGISHNSCEILIRNDNKYLLNQRRKDTDSTQITDYSFANGGRHGKVCHVTSRRYDTFPGRTAVNFRRGSHGLRFYAENSSFLQVFCYLAWNLNGFRMNNNRVLIYVKISLLNWRK